MAQDFTVLRCSQCKMYQVHPARKSNKWQCKVCGLKQSVIKIYGSGSSQDCRRYVQTSNSRGGHLLEAIANEEIPQSNAHEPREIEEKPPSFELPMCSKWTVFTNKDLEDINPTIPDESNKNEDEVSRFDRNKPVNSSKRKLAETETRQYSDAKRRNVQLFSSAKMQNNEDNFQSDQNYFDLPMTSSCITKNTSVAKSPISVQSKIDTQITHVTGSKWAKYT